MPSAATEAEIVDFVRAARADKAPFEIVAGGTRRAVGRPLDLPLLDVSGLSGIVEYQPDELIITARPATPLAGIVAVLAEKGQRLGFDPADWRAVLGSEGTPTLGGAAASDAGGPARLRHGGARDSLLAIRAVNGLGEAFKAGGKVVKNVTGFDLPKLMCGAFGTLGVMTELTFRVYPRAPSSVTLCLADAAPRDGFAALRKIARSALEPIGLCYLPGTMLEGVGQGAALIRLEGARRPLEEKIGMAHGLLGGRMHAIEDEAALFADIGNGARFAGISDDVWRLMIPPSEAPALAERLAVPRWLGDMAGGLLWVAAPPSDAARVRAATAEAGGQAMLLKASPEDRRRLGLYAPPPPALAKLADSVRAAFDPLSLFNPGRL
jgi:glycolate oxidase FAD binding subunit